MRRVLTDLKGQKMEDIAKEVPEVHDFDALLLMMQIELRDPMYSDEAREIITVIAEGHEHEAALWTSEDL